LVAILGVIVFPWLDTIDDFLLHSEYAPYACIFVPLLFSLCYPTLDRWSTARGDTTLILAVTGGVCLGNWFCYQYGWMEKATTLPPYHIINPSLSWLGQMGLRLAIGVVILISTRTIMKMLSFNLVCFLMGCDKNDRTVHQRLVIELPYKFCTYFAIAFNAVFLAPQVFRFLGIERPTYFTEI
jgi:sphingosine-1-phosphate phosphatase 1